jgi:hypothetical protein
LEASADTTLIQTAQQVLAAFKRQDGHALAQFIHPEKGVRFSPYAYIHLSDGAETS